MYINKNIFVLFFFILFFSCESNEDSGVIRGQYALTPEGHSGIDDRDHFPSQVDKPVYHFGRSTYAMKLERSSDFQNGRDRNGHFGFTKVEG